jgi:hypothetical protein
MRINSAILLAALLGLAWGCNQGVDYGPTGTAAGRLTMNGKPLSAGTQVVFMHAEKGYASFGTTDAEGNFKITSWNDGRLPIGKYQVMIQAPAGSAADPDSATAEELLAPQTGELSSAEFPFKYRQVSTSGLSFEVKEGENSFPIDLASE